MSGLDARLREELRTNAGEIRKRVVRSVDALLSDATLALLDRDLAVDLLHLLRNRVTKQILAQLSDRLNRTRAARTLAGVVGASGGTVVAVAVLHAHIITEGETERNPFGRQSSHFFISLGTISTYEFQPLSDSLWITCGQPSAAGRGGIESYALAQ